MCLYLWANGSIGKLVHLTYIVSLRCMSFIQLKILVKSQIEDELASFYQRACSFKGFRAAAANGKLPLCSTTVRLDTQKFGYGLGARVIAVTLAVYLVGFGFMVDGPMCGLYNCVCDGLETPCVGDGNTVNDFRMRDLVDSILRGISGTSEVSGDSVGWTRHGTAWCLVGSWYSIGQVYGSKSCEKVLCNSSNSSNMCKSSKYGCPWFEVGAINISDIEQSVFNDPSDELVELAEWQLQNEESVPKKQETDLPDVDQKLEGEDGVLMYAYACALLARQHFSCRESNPCPRLLFADPPRPVGGLNASPWVPYSQFPCMLFHKFYLTF